MLLMSTYNICFYGEIEKKNFISTPPWKVFWYCSHLDLYLPVLIYLSLVSFVIWMINCMILVLEQCIWYSSIFLWSFLEYAFLVRFYLWLNAPWLFESGDGFVWGNIHILRKFSNDKVILNRFFPRNSAFFYFIHLISKRQVLSVSKEIFLWRTEKNISIWSLLGPYL